VESEGDCLRITSLPFSLEMDRALDSCTQHQAKMASPRLFSNSGEGPYPVVNRHRHLPHDGLRALEDALPRIGIHRQQPAVGRRRVDKHTLLLLQGPFRRCHASVDGTRLPHIIGFRPVVLPEY
jgi:hypothetical protein